MPRNLVLLGSTGSIGRQTLDVVRSSGGRVKVYGLAAHRNVSLLREQIDEFCPAVASVTGPSHLESTAEVELLHGDDGMVELVARPDVDLVVVGTAGKAGLLPTLAALRAGKLVALANKETLIMAGALIRSTLLETAGRLVPIDSEHSAIWQCLQGEPDRAVDRLTLTASGGALRDLPVEELARVTPEHALSHPTWSMGRKITVDSANLMNKGLEVIEAHLLFDLPFDRIEVILHQQSIVHSLVTFTDSSTKAQLGLPDMRLPIQYALSHPDRWPAPFPALDLTEVGKLTFARVDLSRYPALEIAIHAGRAGGTYPAVLSASDEIAVEAFLEERIKFTDIPEVVRSTLDAHTPCSSPRLDDILGADRWARDMSTHLVARMSPTT